MRSGRCSIDGEAAAEVARRLLVLRGLGGMGKTELARQYELQLEKESRVVSTRMTLTACGSSWSSSSL